MPYLVRDDVESMIPPAFLVEALDDDGDHAEDPGLYDKLAATVDVEIDDHVSRKYRLPLASTPPSLRAGAATLFCELLYMRRGLSSEANPFTAKADRFRDYLRQVAEGEAALSLETAPAKPSISIISEKAGTVPTGKING